MSKKIILVILIVIIAIGAYFAFNKPKSPENNIVPVPSGQPTANEKLDPRNTSYIVEGQIVKLENGKEEKQITAEGEKQITEAIGDPAIGDLNSDGQQDRGLIITQRTTGDVGVYYYVAAALVDEKTGLIAGANAVALGDRIEIKDIAIINGGIRVSFLDKTFSGDATESSETMPVTKTFALDGIMLKELFPKQANAKAEAVCTDNRGTWLKESNQCQGLPEDWCNQNGGQYTNALCQF